MQLVEYECNVNYNSVIKKKYLRATVYSGVYIWCGTSLFVADYLLSVWTKLGNLLYVVIHKVKYISNQFSESLNNYKKRITSLRK